MSEMISHSFEKSAFMGERARDQKFYSKVSETAKKIDNALNPKILDDISKRQINGEVSKVVLETTWELPWKSDNAQSLINKTRPESNSTEKNMDEAKKRVEVLAYSTYVAIKNGNNEELNNALGTNDGLAIDSVLPNSLKGIGSKVAEIAINEEIKNPQLKDALKKLDRRTEVLRINGSISKENLKKVIEDKVMELSGLADSLDDGGYEELKKVSAFLGAEADRIEVALVAETETNKVTKVKGLAPDSAEAMMEASKQMMALTNELGERGEQKNLGFKEMREMLDYIEKSGSKSDDISLNSRLKKSLMDVALGTRKIERLPKGINEKDVVKEIRLRLALNDCYLLASADGAKTDEGITRFLNQTRADDTEHEFDRETISFFLCERDGINGEKIVANGIPVDLAWDLRQEAYFNYEKILKEAYANPEVVKRHPQMLTKLNEKGKNEFLDLGKPIMRKNIDYGIYNDYYNNYRCDKESSRRAIVKDYMIEKIMSDRKVSKDVAEKAWELAMKLSVATYTDSAANIAFIDGDDLAEVLMFKFIRYQDGVEGDGEKSAKNKPVGSIETIKYINSLLPVPLAYAQKDDAKRGMYMPIYAHDLEPSKINGKTDLQYVLGPIFHKKAQEVKRAIMTDLTPKEGLNLTYLQQTFERLNKVIAETDTAGWKALNPREYDPDLNKKENLKARQRLFRTWFITGMMERATESPSLGWTRSAYNELERTLFGRKTFIDENSGQGDVFITQEDWKWINKAYKVKSTLKVFEDDERRSKRYLFK